MRIRRVTYDLGNVIETGISGRKVWSTGREESQEEESHTGGSGAGQPMDQGEEGTSQTPDVFQSE